MKPHQEKDHTESCYAEACPNKNKLESCDHCGEETESFSRRYVPTMSTYGGKYGVVCIGCLPWHMRKFEHERGENS